MYRISRITLLFLILGLGAESLEAQWWRDPFGVAQRRADREEAVRGAATEAEEQRARELFAEATEELERGQLLASRRKFNEVAQRYRRTEVAPDALLRVAQIYRKQHRFNRAFDTSQRVIRRYPDYPNFDEVIRTQFEIATSVMEGQRGRFLRVIPTFRNITRSRRYFEVMIRNAPFSDYAPMALMNIAMVSHQKGEQEYAVDALDRLINFYSNSLFAPDAYFLLGEIFADMVDGPEYDQNSTEQAISYFQDFLILFPDHHRVEDAETGLREMQEIMAESKFLLGDYFYRYRGNTTAALVYYNETITVAPNSRAAADARQRIERIREGRPPPRTGLGIAQLWNRIRSGGTPRDAELIRREQEELDRAERSEAIPAPASPRG